MTSMELQLSKYYERNGISPEDFRCPHQAWCESYCTSGNFQTPNEGARVSDFYQDRAYLNHHIPRIVVISLSAPVPEPKAKPNGHIERDDNNGPLNPHWIETLAMVRSLLNAFLEKDLPGPARRSEDESTKQVEKLFVHLRTAKCSSQQNEEDYRVYETCGHYLGGELRILKPNVIITQGAKARDQLEKHLIRKKVVKVIETRGKPLHIHAVTLDDERKACWIPTIHPTVPNNSYSLQVDSENGKPRSTMKKYLLKCGRFIKCIHEFL